MEECDGAADWNVFYGLPIVNFIYLFPSIWLNSITLALQINSSCNPQSDMILEATTYYGWGGDGSDLKGEMTYG